VRPRLEEKEKTRFQSPARGNGRPPGGPAPRETSALIHYRRDRNPTERSDPDSQEFAGHGISRTVEVKAIRSRPATGQLVEYPNAPGGKRQMTNTPCPGLRP